MKRLGGVPLLGRVDLLTSSNVCGAPGLVRVICGRRSSFWTGMGVNWTLVGEVGAMAAVGSWFSEVVNAGGMVQRLSFVTDVAGRSFEERSSLSKARWWCCPLDRASCCLTRGLMDLQKTYYPTTSLVAQHWLLGMVQWVVC